MYCIALSLKESKKMKSQKSLLNSNISANKPSPDRKQICMYKAGSNYDDGLLAEILLFKTLFVFFLFFRFLRGKLNILFLTG